jgi:hypothetical protein
MFNNMKFILWVLILGSQSVSRTAAPAAPAPYRTLLNRSAKDWWEGWTGSFRKGFSSEGWR